MARWYGSTTERGLNGTHAADLKRLRAQHRDGDPCWRCGQPMYKTQALERDHVIDRVLGGADGPAVLAHASCNRSAGATLGNKIHGFKAAAAGRDVTCKTCGKPYHYAARSCEMCGVHYHPSYGEQRTCGRACGRVLQQRNKRATGWLPKAERPKPPRMPRMPREPAAWPSSKIWPYTCRYCGTPAVTHGRGGQREVCTARECQLARLMANNLRTRNGLPKEDADAQMAAIVTNGQPPAYEQWRSSRPW